MGVERSQSEINEVRDQMSLDFADGRYLNRVAANLGLTRPPYGFTDDVWRALVKAVALQPKVLRTKFEEILTIILGPRVTQCGALAENVSVGDTSAVLVGTSQFPQVGTMVLDEGLPTEEVIGYGYIDRYTNRVYFDTPTTQAHVAVKQEWESGIIAATDTSASEVNVYDATGFPTAVPYTVCVGRGTPYETAGPLTAVTPEARLLTTPILLDGVSGASSARAEVVNLIAQQSSEGAYYLNLLDVSPMQPEKGYFQCVLDNQLTATAGTVSTVTVSSSLTENVYGGFWIRFDGNVTSALEHAVGYVSSNTTNVFTLSNVLPAAPASGDTFSLLANVQYLRASDDDDTVLMPREFPDLQVLAPSAQLTVMEPTATVAIAQVQVKGVDWDLFEVDKNHVEILLPKNVMTHDLRSASYIRDSSLSGTATADAGRLVDETTISVSDTSTLPPIGVVDHVVESIRYFYYVPQCWLSEPVTAGATTLLVTDTSQFPSAGTLTVDGHSLLFSVVDETTLSVSAVPADIEIGTLVQDSHTLMVPAGLTASVTTGDSLAFYSNYASGDVWNVDDTWPGPYVWSLFDAVHKKEAGASSTATTAVSGPTQLTVDRLVGATVLEVDDASSFPTLVPFQVLLGEGGGNQETLAVQEVSLRSRTHTTLASPVVPGDETLPVAALAGPTGPQHTFPDGGPYRVVLSPFTVDQEVVDVIGTEISPDTLVLSPLTPVVYAHAVGTPVLLLADLLRISPGTVDDHVGKIAFSHRTQFYSPETQVSRADKVRPIYDSLTLSGTGVDFAESDSTIVFNFGNGVASASSSLVSITGTAIELEDTSAFPTTGYPYTIYLDVGAGPILEEVLHVVHNNGTDTLTVSHAPVYTHLPGRRVEFRAGVHEEVSYNSRVGNVLSFSPRLEVEHTHHMTERIAPTVGSGFPRSNGYDFPLRIPSSITDQIQHMLDLVRAAGVEVTFISTR